MQSSSEEIKNKLDIVEVIGQYVKLQKAGANYRGLCPFHKEKTPSFFVSPSRQIWHCFGCSLGGDIFSFIIKIENIEFKEALKILAQKAGVDLVYENPQVRSQKQRIIDVNKEAAGFFEQNLWKEKAVIDYLLKRGLKEETIKEFHLGWASDEWNELSNFLVKKGFKSNEILASGLAIPKNTDIYDRFRSRIMFPIEDSSNNIVAFTGRIFQGTASLKTIRDIEKIGKYINSPQTLIFDKSKILYGLSKSKNYLRSEENTLLVEGQMDFLAAWQSGIKNMVATSGTALTPYQLKILKRYNDTLVLGFDMDEAGEKAAERGIELALSKEFNVKILRLSEGKDLADFLMDKENKVNIKDLVKKAEAIMDFYFARAQNEGDKTNIDGKKAIASYFLPKIKKLNNVLDRSFWINKLSRFINIPDQALEDELNRLQEGGDELIVDENESLYQFPATQLRSRIDGIAERIISFLIKMPSLKKEASSYESYFPESFQTIFQVIKNISSGEDLSTKSLKKVNLPEGLINQINQLALRADYETELLEKFQVSIEEEFEKELRELKKEYIKKRLEGMEKEIRVAEKNEDKKTLKDLITKFNELSKQLLN
ncbi:MAG TPA: DNA primase [Candidatus Paceibacterota bacterium]|nr:DNA primase [Candidatus Paceibacterota bacterium]